jgi:Nucleotide-diphospho-sugar transferase
LPDPRDGFLFAATGEKYAGLARRAAANLRQVMPQAQIDLFTDQKIDDPTFDRIHPVTASFFRPKMEALANSRFERTVYLDSDAIALADVSELFAVLDRFDIAGAHMQYPNTTLAIGDPTVPDSFPQINAGVLALKRSPATQSLLQDWGRSVRDTGAAFDQPSLRRLLWESDLRLTILPMEYNFKCMTFLEVLDSRHRAPKIMHFSELNATEKWRESGPLTLDELIGARRADQVRKLQAAARLPESAAVAVQPLFRQVYAMTNPQYYLRRYGRGILRRVSRRLLGQTTPPATKDPEAK